MRYRNMYYLTGQPGWMRLGYSPGWIGRSPSGLGPCAEYLLSGRWPLAPTSFPGQTAEAAQTLELLKAQADRLEQLLGQIRSRIEEIEKKS
jgi:hypothetical protein